MNENSATLQASAIVPAGRSVLDIAADREKRQGLLRHLEATGKKQYEGQQYVEMEAYLLSDNCVEDLMRLRQGDFFFAPPFHYRVPKNASGAMRDVYAFKGREKYLLRLIAWVMHDYDDTLPQGLYSFRRSVQARDFLKKVRNFKDFEKYYIVKADVSNYVGSIVPEKIIPQLEVIWQHDPALLNLLRFLLLRRECIDQDGNVVACEPGGMGGIPVANYFMNVYLIEMDLYFYGRAPLYSRYSDDVVILARSLPEAEAYRERFLQILQERQLVTNPNKTRLLMPGESVEILGYKVCRGKIDISDHAMQKIKRKLRIKSRKMLQYKRQKHLTDVQAAQQMIDYCNYVLYGDAGKHELSWARWYFPVLTTADGLREVDRYAQDAIRFVMCGSLRRKRYSIRYEELQDLGYKSLVHAYYHFDPVVMEQAKE
ncbi:MAG: hypothetical protein IJI26_05610 [Clostridia bacterium]|nr:hypothetical protein [Clostridia bacterium]